MTIIIDIDVITIAELTHLKSYYSFILLLSLLKSSKSIGFFKAIPILFTL